MSYDLPALCRQVRRDILTMTHAAGSGHPGGSLSAVEILVTLYFDQMHLDPAHPEDPNRDRFLLSKGHAAPVLYSALARRGFFDPALLPTLHRVTVINAGTLYSVYAGFQSIRITKFRTPVRQDIFKHGSEFIGSHTLFQTVKNKTDSTFRAAVHQKGKKQLFLCEKEGK